MNRVFYILVILLGASATVWFVKLNSLPNVDELIDLESSLTENMNNLLYVMLKNNSKKAIETGRNFRGRMKETINEIERVSDFVSVLSDRFDKIESGEESPESLIPQISSVKKSLRFKLLRNEWSDEDPVDSTIIVKLLDAIEMRSTRAANTSNNKLRRLAIRSIRSETYNMLNFYIERLDRFVGGTTLKFGTGFPQQEETWKKGLIAFNPPVTMELNEKERIQVRISKDLQSDLWKKMPASEAAMIDSLLVGDAMIVRLTGDDFDIVAYDEEEQGVTDDGYTQWEFDVTPRSTGNHTLFVKAGIVYSVPGLGATKKFFPVYERQIQIHVNIWKRVTTFATERWEFLISTFLIPTITWVWARRKKKVKDSTISASEQPS